MIAISVGGYGNAVGKSLQNKIRKSSVNLEKNFKLDEFITICKEVVDSEEDFGVIAKHTAMVNFFGKICEGYSKFGINLKKYVISSSQFNNKFN